MTIFAYMTTITQDADATAIVPSPEQLKALTHPIRLRLLGLLRLNGPQTATQLAHTTHLNTGSTSYHLRMLAKYGFIEKDGSMSSGRRLFWRASQLSTVTHASTGDERDDSGEIDALDAFQQVIATEFSRQLLDASQRWITLPPTWRDIYTTSGFVMRVNADEARELVGKIQKILVDAMHAHPLGLSARHSNSTDARAFSIQLNAFPTIGDDAAERNGKER